VDSRKPMGRTSAVASELQHDSFGTFGISFDNTGAARIAHPR
jgi:hypothetical protein